MAIFASAIDAALLWGIKSFMGLISQNPVLQLWEWILLMVLLTTLRLILLSSKIKTQESTLFKTCTQTSQWFLQSLRNLSPRLFHNGRGNDLVESAYEATQVLQANGSVFFQAIQAILQLAVFFPVLLYISWPLTLFLFAVVVPLVAIMQKKLHAMGPEEENLLRDRSQLHVHLIRANTFYRNWSNQYEQEQITEQLDKDIQNLGNRSETASVRKNVLSSITESISVLAMVIVLAFCALLISKGWMNGEGLVLFCSAVLLCYKPIKECARTMPQFRSAMSAYNILSNFEKLPQKQTKEQASAITDSLEIFQGNFTYENATSPVFENFNVHWEMDKPILLRGHNGIGKSTLLRLLAGLEEWNQRQCTSKVFFIPQDLELPPRKLLQSQLQKKNDALLVEFMALTHTDSLLSKEGLSGGERSRIALTWALASDASILLLDEPMSAINLEDREIILQKFLDICKAQKKWVIIASHDPFSNGIQQQFTLVEMEHAKT